MSKTGWMLAIAACWVFEVVVFAVVFRWGLLIMLPLAYLVHHLEENWRGYRR